MNQTKNIALNFLLLLLTASLSAQAVLGQQPTPPKSAGNIKVKYDKGKDRTTISLKSSTITTLSQEQSVASNLPVHQMDFEAWFTYAGQFPTQQPSEAVFRFHCAASTYIFMKGQEVLVATDREVPGKDRGFSLGMSGYRSTAPKFNSIYEEFMDVRVPVDAIRKIAAAQSAEIYLGPISYRLSPKQLESFRHIEAYLPKS